ncbi:MAG: metallophosphoesterase family protein [Arcobacteraceae bacterium]
MKNIYIISDVHGCYKTLLALIEQFPYKQNSKIVFVGDLVDRGENSYNVVQFVMENNYDCVKGNHEDMLLEYGSITKDETLAKIAKHWLNSCGGNETIKSYKNNEDYIKHYDYLDSLPIYIEYKDYKTENSRYLVVSHSAIGTVWECKDSQYEIDKDIFESHILWSREPSIDIKEIFNVYGHTMFEEPKMNEFSCGIDLGCCYKENPKKIPNPRLCALEFPSMKLFTQENLED